MKKLENMNYQELVELEKQITELKKQAEGRLSKGDTSYVMWEMFGKKIATRLMEEGYSEDVSYSAVHPMVSAVHKLCDMAYGNYKPLKSKKVKTMTVPSTNGSMIMVDNPKGYEKLVSDIALLVANSIDEERN